MATKPFHPAAAGGASMLELEIDVQPDDSSCGPTCLHAVYRYFGDEISQQTTLAEVRRLPNGGSLSAFLALHALKRGYEATIYTYNLQLFDPTWFAAQDVDLAAKLQQQMTHKRDDKLTFASEAYIEYLKLGGRILFEPLTPALISSYLDRSIPLLTGLSATFLHSTPRENERTGEYDDIGGEPVGHFVVMHGVDQDHSSVLVADPYLHTPTAGGHYYSVDLGRAVCAIMLGIITYDANFLVIEPKR